MLIEFDTLIKYTLLNNLSGFFLLSNFFFISQLENGDFFEKKSNVFSFRTLKRVKESKIYTY